MMGRPRFASTPEVVLCFFEDSHGTWSIVVASRDSTYFPRGTIRPKNITLNYVRLGLNQAPASTREFVK